MKRTLFFPIALLLLVLTGCRHGNIVYDEQHTFERDSWNHFKPEQFDINIDNEEDYYHIDFCVSVDTVRYRYDEFPCMIILTSPAGEERQFYHTMLLKENGHWRGEVDGDYRTVRGRVRSYFTFNRHGEHSMKVAQATSQYDLEGIHSLQVQVEKAKLEYNL